MLKTNQKRLPKSFSITLHINAIENKFLRIRKRQTGLSISDLIREGWLSETAELFFGERKKAARNGLPAASAPPLQ